MKYRREIDGLRALAVVPVVLFHAGFTLFGGGFVGVDVFFVISGYLITSIILTEKQAGTFTLASFYERRARRILPALFLVLAASLVAAWLCLLPADMEGYSESLFATVSFSSNIYFFLTTGYFGNTAEYKPLLHTWSLSVEEQFYLLFPWLVLLGWGRRPAPVLAGLGLIAVASLATAQLGDKPFSPTTFFLLPARGWELLIGSLAAYGVWLRNQRGHDPLASQALSLLGVLLITAAVLGFDKSTPFPGLYALVPTVGALLIILFATGDTWAGRLLGSSAFAGVGLVSYSAYLWHQPLLAFARQLSMDALSTPRLALLVAASFVLACGSWKYVEVPLRDRQRFSRSQVFALAGCGSLFFIVMGLAGHYSRGFEGRLTANERRINAFSTYKFDRLYSRHVCFLEREGTPADFSNTCQQVAHPAQALLLWGDSHAASFSEGLRQQHGDVMQYTASLCPPILGVDFRDRPNCRSINNFVLDQIRRLQPHEIWLLGTWNAYGPLASPQAIESTLSQIRMASPASQITLMGGLPDWPRPLPVVAMRSGVILDRERALPMSTLAQLRQVDGELEPVAAAAGVRFLSALRALCSDQQCPVVTAYAGHFDLVAWDRSHLTQAGSMLLAKRLLPGPPAAAAR